ncbi:cysteine desulfurase [Frondihabitans sp. PAMC 28766]|uniref:cysteine desulfurase family protein n=1 Tax=Frondihabitans sp. PAMC 28766 TaxID=1795630 RepID=UPI00078EB875|nr:cysteine desulfurase family protein [Frondihabitans sp. PAMC 28766]AMM22034.1 cysteine desulfurase [Frondihabitans sp. PAMC 28766]
MLYLDAAATTPVRREALEAMWPYLTGDFGNPSSHHTVGESAARGLARARSQVAEMLGCRPAEIVFTGGGTEADNLAIKGIALGRPRGRHIVTTAIEHEAVLSSIDYLVRTHGFEVSFAPLTAEGLVTPAALAAVLRPDTTLVSIAHANNEIGTVQDLEALTAATRAHRVPFHTDAVQSAGQLPVDVGALGVQALSLSGHKLGAPKGTGVLFVAGALPLEPVLHGGGQERGRRSGTENVAGAVALGVAASLVSLSPVSVAARDDFIAAVLARVPGAQLTGADGAPGARRLPRHASFVFPGTSGESVLLELERRGVVSSSGSACAAGSDEPSHVLTALVVPAEVAQTAVRFTWAADVTAAQLLEVAGLLRESVAAVRSIVA